MNEIKIRVRVIRIFISFLHYVRNDMRTLFCLLVSFIIHAQVASAQTGGKDQLKPSVISSFPLQKITDSSFTSFHFANSGKPYLLFIYLSPDCPFSKNYTLTLNKLFQQYSDSVQFYGCIAGATYQPSEIASFITTYKIVFPVVVDENKKLAAYLTATVTPEVILLNKDGKRLYSGAIDDWAQGWGKQKLMVTKHYLEDAIVASLTHKKVTVKKTTAYGCMINDY